jgi:alkylation response protein AidB-like acyl-CoA dehydrogenase
MSNDRFVQEPPTLDNQYETDRVLRSYLQRQLPDAVLADVEGELDDLGALAGGELYDLQLEDLGNEPSLTRWDAWGERVDTVDVTDVWKRAAVEAAERGIVAAAYERRHGRHSRVHQMALAYLFIPSTDMYGCPLAMTDGAARTLLESGSDALIDRALPHLTSRDPDSFWTAGQWMTELAGGSDVGRARTTARRDGDTWRLSGRKWFTSAVNADVALALARPEGNPGGGEGLALFYVPLREGGSLCEGVQVNRLKDKLGTRKLPTAELDLDGAPAELVTGEAHRGTRHIAPMLNVTRTWNAVTASAFIRRGLALARDYGQKREAFGDAIINHPLHQETLADAQSTLEGAFHLTFRVAELLGAQEAGQTDEADEALLRILTPVAKLTTAKQAVSTSSEMLEAFGGAGYVEDTGLPALLRDAQVLPIWEGTTNVLALDTLRALRRHGSIAPLKREFKQCIDAVDAPTLRDALRPALVAFRDAVQWLHRAIGDEEALQAGARRFALTLGRALELALTARHAQWSLDTEQDGRSAAAAERLAARRINRVADLDHHGAYVLVWDFNCPTLFDCHAQGGDGTAESADEIASLDPAVHQAEDADPQASPTSE